MHYRTPSVNSQSFAVHVDLNQLDDDDTNSTDSYQDSIVEDEDQHIIINPVDYLTSALELSLSNVEFNNSMVLQAKNSGNLKSKEKELAQLQSEAQEKLKEFSRTFKQGLKVLKLVSKDLNATKRHIRKLQGQVQSEFPLEYAQAKDKVLSRNIDPKDILNKDNDEIYI